MNTRQKTFLLNGLTHGFLFFALGFIVGHYGFNLPLQKALIDATPAALVSFVLYGLFQSRFTKSTKVLNAIIISPEVAVTFVLETPGNHTIDEHMVSGKLVLTEKELIFKSYEQIQYSWPLDTLHSFTFYPSLFNAGGEFITEDGNSNRLVFEVDEIRLWKKHLLKM